MQHVYRNCVQNQQISKPCHKPNTLIIKCPQVFKILMNYQLKLKKTRQILFSIS